MTVKKLANTWYVLNSEGEAVAGFTTKKMALHAMENYMRSGMK